MYTPALAISTDPVEVNDIKAFRVFHPLGAAAHSALTEVFRLFQP